MRKLSAPFVLALVLALPPASAPAAVSVGHSGWTWGSPAPQGNTIGAVEFAGARGYGAGEFGTLLRSDDGGATWTGVSTGITNDVREVRVIGGSSVVIAAGCSLRRSDDAGATFRRLHVVNETRCSSPVSSLSFPSGNVGYFGLENGSVLRSDDGGDTVSSRTAVPGVVSGVRLVDLWFVAEGTGVAATSSGAIYRTTDGAVSWSPVHSGAGPLNGLFFTDAANGYAVGPRLLLRTTDGGVTWEQQAMDGAPAVNLQDIRCGNETTCILTTGAGDQLIRTTDGGETAVSVTPSTPRIFAATFASPMRVVAAGDGGAMVVSDDAGQTFFPIGSRLPGNYLGLEAQSGSTAYAFGLGGSLARTTNGGETWGNLSAPTDQDIVATSFASPETGFALDSTGSLLRTDNGGASWRILDTGGTRPATVVALTEERVVLVGPTGIRLSTNGGDEFSTVRSDVIRSARVSQADRVGTGVFVWSGRFLAVSADGSRWRRLLRPSRFAIRRVDFVSPKVGFLLDANGRVWKTKDQGRTWTERLSLGTSRAYDMAFSNERSGWVTIRSFGRLTEHGLVLRTTDSGATWRPQLIGPQPILPDGLAAAGDSGFALANGELFATRVGGDAGAASTLRLRTRLRKLEKPASISVTGTLAPAEGGELVVVARREIGANRWAFQTVTAAANGSFTTRWRVRRTSWFVAQWIGDDDRAGDGSEPLRVQRGALPRPSPAKP